VVEKENNTCSASLDKRSTSNTATVLLESKFKEHVIEMIEFLSDYTLDIDSIISIACLFFHLKVVMDLIIFANRDFNGILSS
jgi:hypothetical protein